MAPQLCAVQKNQPNKTILHIIKTNPDFSTLQTIVKKAGPETEQTLSDKEAFIHFAAPNNAAFKKLAKEDPKKLNTLKTNQAAAKEFVNRLMNPSQEITHPTQVMPMGKTTTMSKSSFQNTIDTINGIMHIIGPLLPLLTWL